jgi:muconolactone delta-isomerase
LGHAKYDEMKIMAFEHELPGASREQFRRYAREEARQAWELHQVGVVRELYFRADQNTAVLVLECTSTDEAETMLAKLPFVREGLIRFELIPLQAYSGFARLFGDEQIGYGANYE